MMKRMLFDEAEETRESSRRGLAALAEASRKVVREMDVEGMLAAACEGSLELTGGRAAVCVQGYAGGRFGHLGSAGAFDPGPLAGFPGFVLENGGVYLDLMEDAGSMRMSMAELCVRPHWWGLPTAEATAGGLLAVKLCSRSGTPSGLLLVLGKEQGEFTAEDESLLVQHAALTSLAMQHIELRVALEDSERQRNQFLGMLSHELRNPLTPIRNSLFILERAEPGGEKALRARGVIDRQVSHLTRLVDDLLDVTRISSGKVRLRRERLDVGELARGAVEDHRSMFTRNGQELNACLPDHPIFVSGDRTRVSQIIGNLLNNAAKFTGQGGSVAVSVESRDGHAVVRVEDNGVGIAPDLACRLFDPFSQADTTLDRSKGGLGLGLALVRGLVEMHGGSVSVASEGLGKGSEFTVRLPLLESTSVPIAAPADAGPSDGAQRRILVIEDNVDAADSLREVLLSFGDHEVEVAYTGPQGIEKAREFGPDLVLCDIGLPGMDGYEVARTMRKDEALGSIGLVALSGYALPEDVARAREAGFDRHLAKPPAIDALEKLVQRRHVGERRQS